MFNRFILPSARTLNQALLVFFAMVNFGWQKPNELDWRGLSLASNGLNMVRATLYSIIFFGFINVQTY